MPDFSAFNVNPRAALGVRVTLGRQPPDRIGSGFPIAKDRFWLCAPIADAVQIGKRAAQRSTSGGVRGAIDPTTRD